MNRQSKENQLNGWASTEFGETMFGDIPPTDEDIYFMI